MGFDEKIPLSLYRRVSQLWTGLAYFGKNYAASVSKISSRSFLVSLTHLAGLRGRSTSSCAGASQSSETIFRRDSHIPQGRRRLRRHRGTQVGTEECGTTLPPPPLASHVRRRATAVPVSTRKLERVRDFEERSVRCRQRRGGGGGG